MRHSARPGLVLLLAALLCAQALGYWLVLGARERALEERVQERIGNSPAGGLSRLAIPRAWYEAGHPQFRRTEEREVRYMGRMYDVVRVEEKKDTVVLYAWFDEAESRLLNEADPDKAAGAAPQKLPGGLFPAPGLAPGNLALPDDHPGRKKEKVLFFVKNLQTGLPAGPLAPPPESQSLLIC